MCKHEEKYCPRCHTLFECKTGSILLCQCSSVTLTENERQYIYRYYDDCLCASCLRALQEMYREENLVG